MHEMDVHQRCRIGDRRMAAVQNADLHMFIGRHVRNECDADLFKRRAPGGKLILQHPLFELFAEDRPVILDTERILNEIDFALARRRRDAIHHAVRESRHSP
jgi:hypothetical protein